MLVNVMKYLITIFYVCNFIIYFFVFLNKYIMFKIFCRLSVKMFNHSGHCKYLICKENKYILI